MHNIQSTFLTFPQTNLQGYYGGYYLVDISIIVFVVILIGLTDFIINKLRKVPAKHSHLARWSFILGLLAAISMLGFLENGGVALNGPQVYSFDNLLKFMPFLGGALAACAMALGITAFFKNKDRLALSGFFLGISVVILFLIIIALTKGDVIPHMPAVIGFERF